MRSRLPGFGAATIVVLATVTFAGCSSSMREYSRATPRPAGPALAVVPQSIQTGTPAENELEAPPPIALAPEQTGVVTADPIASQLPQGADQTTEGGPNNKKKILTPEEKARVIAELEALARRQADF